MQVMLASVASNLQANGGTTTIGVAELTEKLENIAAAIEAGVTPQATALNFECLPQDLPEVLTLVSDVLQCAPVLRAFLANSFFLLGVFVPLFLFLNLLHMVHSLKCHVSAMRTCLHPMLAFAGTRLCQRAN